MTTATNPGNYVDFDEYVGLKLDKTRSTIRNTDLLTALAGVSAMFLGYLLVFVVLDQWVIRDGFGVFWRWVLLSTLMVCTVGWLVWKVGIPSLRTVNRLFAAQEIEKSEPELKSNLLNLIDLKAAGRTVNPAILKSLERQAAVRLQQVDVAQAIDHRPLVRTAYVLLAIIVVFCFYALLSPKKISNSIWRGLFPSANVSLATITEILDVKPGDVTVPAHQPLVDIQVDLAGEIPAQVWLLYSTADGKQDQPVELRPDQGGQTRFKGQLIGESGQGLTHDLTYFVRAGDASSRKYKITVEQPPYAEIESVKIEFPSYMKLQPVEQAANGAIDAWEGAKVIVNAKTNMPIRSALVQFLDDPLTGPSGEEVAASVTGNGRQIQAQWTLALRSDGTFPKFYRIHCRTEDGKVTTGHVMYPLTIRPDQPPEVVLMQPDRDLDAPANATIPLLIQARDPDFELGYVYLNVEKGGNKIRDQLSEGRESKLTLTHELGLQKLNAQAGDEIDVWVEAYDNKQPRPNSKNTPKIRIRVVAPVSQKEADQQLAEQKEIREKKLAEADSETNSDQPKPGEQKDDGTEDRHPSNEPRQNENDPKPDENPKTDPNNGSREQQGASNSSKSGTDQNSNGGTGKSANSQKSATGKSGTDDRQQDQSKPPAGEGSKSEKPLSNDGSQDEEIIRRLNDQLNKNKPPKTERKDETREADNSTQPEKPEQPGSPSEQSPENQPQNSPDDRSGDKNNGESLPKKDRVKNGIDSKKTDSAADKSTEHDPAMDPNAAEKDVPDGVTPPVADPKRQPPKTGEKKEDVTSPERKKNPDKTPKSSAPTENSPTQDPKIENPPDDTHPTPTPKPNHEQKAEKKRPSGVKESTEKTNPSKAEKTSPEKKTDDPNDSSENQKESQSEPTASEDPSQNSSDKPAESKSDPKSDQNDKGTNPDKKPDSTDQKSPGNSEDNKTTADKEASENLPTGLNEKTTKKSPSETGTAKKPKSSSQDKNTDSKGPKEQVPDSADAEKKTADGTEEGVGTPDRDPTQKPDAKRNDKVTRDPKVNPEKRPGDSDDSPDGKTEKPDGSKSDRGTPKAIPSKPKSQGEKPPSGKSEAEEPMTGDENGSQPGGEESDETSKKSSEGTSKEQGTTEQADPSESPSNGQKTQETSQKIENGKKGGGKTKSSKSEPSGKSTPKDQGNGDTSSDEKNAGNDKQPSDSDNVEKRAQDKNSSDPKSDEPKSGDKSKSGGEKSGADKSGTKSEGGGKGSGSKPGKGGTGSGSAQGAGGTSSLNGDNNSDASNGYNQNGIEEPTQDSSSATEKGEDANLEYNQKATELILQTLKKDLERGEVDQELLDQLGWTPAELKQFADRLSKSLKESKLAEETAESKARQQQFQEMLKNLDLQKSGTQRSGEKEPKRNVSQIESKRSTPPPAYRSAIEKFTRDMARQKPAQPVDARRKKGTE